MGLRIAKRLDGALGGSDITGDHPIEIFGMNGIETERELISLRRNLGRVVVIYRRAVNRRNIAVEQQVVGVGIEIVELQVDQMLEQGEVETAVELQLLLPFETGVGNVGTDNRTDVEKIGSEVIVLGVVRREAAVTGKAHLGREIQHIDPRRQSSRIGSKESQAGRREESETGSVESRNGRTVDRETGHSFHQMVESIIGMQVVAEPLPLVVVTVDNSFVEIGRQSFVIVVGRVVTRLEIVLEVPGNQPHATIGLEVVYIIENLLVHGIRAVEVRRQLTHAFAHVVESCPVELGHDGLIGYTGNEKRLFGIVVVDVDHTGDRPVLGRPPVETGPHIDIVYLVVGLDGIDQSQRVTYIIVSENGILVDIPAVIGRIRRQEISVRLPSIGIEIGHHKGRCQQRVGLVFHALLLQIAGNVSEIDVGENVDPPAHHHVGVDQRMETLRRGIVDDTAFVGVTQ